MRSVSDVQWLDDEEQRAWRSFVGALRHVRMNVDRPVQDETGLSSIDYSVLVYLSESPDRQARMSELADFAVVSSSQLTYRVDRLVKLGYLERRPCPTDRRGSIAVLTDPGLAAFEQAAAVHVATVRLAFLDRLTRDELLTVGRLLAKVVDEPAPS
jgi:DNA-binding MarR family transcriptional regulator